MSISDKVAARLRGILKEGEPHSTEQIVTSSHATRAKGPSPAAHVTLVDGAAAGSLGSYEIEAVLGVGGMGTVYRATDRITGRPVALKVPHAGDFPFSGRFERETEFSHALGQIGDAPYLDHGVSSAGTPFMAMPLLSGRTLHERLRGGETFKPSEVLRVGERVAHVLASLHSRGLIHRDVKPSNVLIDEANTVWLMDHGLTGGPRTLQGAGTTIYAAPEQLANGPVGSAADVYALGLVMLELWRGARVHDNAMARLEMLEHTAVDEKLDEVDNVPVRELLRQMLQTDPSLRPANGAVVARAIARTRTRGALVSRALDCRARCLFQQSPGMRGRDEELAAMVRAIETRGEVTLAGPPGSGKSRLIVAWWQAHAPISAALAWPVESVSPRPRDPYDLARRWLLALAGVRGGERPVVEEAALRELAVAVGGDAALAAQTSGGSPDAVAGALMLLLGRIAERGPLVLVADHGRAVDPQSLDVARELRRRYGASVIVIHEHATAHNGDVFLGPHPHRTLQEMASAGVRGDVERGLRYAHGNPLSLCAHALAPGSSTEEALAHYINTLDPYARWLLRLASLCGLVFDARTVLEVVGLCDGAMVRDGLARLAHTGLLIDLTRELGAATGTYQFAHGEVLRVARSAWSGSDLALGAKLLGAR